MVLDFSGFKDKVYTKAERLSNARMREAYHRKQMEYYLEEIKLLEEELELE